MSEDSGLDLGRAREIFEDSQDFTVGLEEEFAIVDPDSLELAHEFPAMMEACDEDELLAVAAAGELIDTEIEIRSGRARTSPTPPRCRPSIASASSLSPTRWAWGSRSWGTHPWASYLDQQIIDTEHYNRLRGELQWVALRNNTWSNHVHVGDQRGGPRDRRVRSPARGRCRRSSRCRRTHRSWTATTPGFTRSARRSSPAPSRAAASTSRSGTGRRTRRSSSGSTRPARSSRRRSSGGACGRITGSGRSSSGSATRRPTATSRSPWRR